MNAGCLRPIEIVVPKGSLLNPVPPAAVAAGNVETSQAVVDALFGALGVMAASQGTMNKLTFGNERHQYYETICGGAGATAQSDGQSAVQTHMTNSRLTDPEVLEMRFPVIVEEFSIRHGSGGKGQYRAGDGTRRCIRFREPMRVAILSTPGGKPIPSASMVVHRGRVAKTSAAGRMGRWTYSMPVMRLRFNQAMPLSLPRQEAAGGDGPGRF